MKRRILISIAMMGIGFSHPAGAQNKGTGFYAPATTDKNSVVSELGSIILDTTSQTFWGRNSTTWIEFGGSGSVPAGAITAFAGANAPAGYLFCNGQTIGSGSSGATAMASASTQDLFLLLWDSFSNSQLPIQDSTGAASTRGASAAADFSANKRMPLPDFRGRIAAGTDDMGSTTAQNRITTGGSGIAGTTLGATGGVETHTLTGAESGVASHAHSYAEPASGLGHAHLLPRESGSGTPGVYTGPVINDNRSQTTSSAYTYYSTTGITINNAGPTSASSAHQNTQPTIIMNYIIKY